MTHCSADSSASKSVPKRATIAKAATASGRLRVRGTQRPASASSSTRASARGESRASHSPPSAAKHFCGAK